VRLLSARVAGYGPLDDVDLDLDAPLHVVHGPNESGKTSLLDFLLCHLFRWEQRRGTRTETVLQGLGRFGEPGEGAGEVELRLAGSVHRYPGDGPSLLHELGLEYAGLTGLFCVRSGELELPEKEEGDFWRELKKVLSGLPEGVETLRERARDEAGLVPSGSRLKDRGSPGLRTRYESLRERKATLEELTGRLDEISEVAEDVARLEEEKERLERARRARIARLAGDLEEARGRLDDLPAVPRRTLERWERLADERERLEEAIEQARRGREEAEAAARERRRERDEAERRAEGLRERLGRVREAEMEERSRRLETDEPSGVLARIADPLYWVGAVVLVMAIGVTFFVPSSDLVRPTWLLAAGGALLVGAGLFFTGRGLRRRRDRATEERAALLEDAAACGLDVEGPASIPAAVRSLESDVHEAERELEGARARLESAQERLEERTEALEEKADRLEGTEEELASLRREISAGGPDPEAGADDAGGEGGVDLDTARSRAEEREALKDRVEQIEAELQGLAGRDAPARDEVAPPDDADELPPWSASDHRRIEERLDGLRRRHRELVRAFDRAGLAEPEDALTELQACREEIRDIELSRDAGRLAAEIFGTMDQALEERLGDALSREGEHSVQALLHRVTGRYRELRRGDDGGLVAGDGRGRSRELSNLSRGTRDQVHLALRLGLARAALEAAGLDEPGFFLLDDAFLTADWTRRERLVEAAADLADEGWQVLYLTCDDHLRDLFVEAGAREHGL
jgi:uncharacterized protein YhaN